MDDDVYDWLRYWRWSLSTNGKGTKYGRRLGTNPYLQKYQFIYLHKIIAGISKDYRLHFRDSNSLNMQRANLEIVNLYREPVKWWGSNGRSVFTGVEWDKYYGLWKACLEGLAVGYFVSEMDAAIAYNDKAVEVYGEDAVLNNLELGVL